MNVERFNEIVEEVLGHCKETLVKKADDYARDYDRLNNFKAVSQQTGVMPEHVLLVWQSKHANAVKDFIEDIKSKEKKRTREEWKEKIGDIINYNILLLALLEDEKNIEGE